MRFSDQNKSLGKLLTSWPEAASAFQLGSMASRKDCAAA
jgi:hypothetical protein